MSERPLLLFPSSGKEPREKGSGRYVPRPTPSVERQHERIGRKLARLNQAFDTRRVELQRSEMGIDPELALVIETINSADEFIGAVKGTEGLEWLGEFGVEEIELDKEFLKSKESAGKKDTGRLYCLMTNRGALEDLLSLWEKYDRSGRRKEMLEDAPGGFIDIFTQVHDIRWWNAMDRLGEEGGLFEDWQIKLRHGAENVRFEAEFWFREHSRAREQHAQHLEELVHRMGGRVLAQSVIREIAYHGLLAELPSDSIKSAMEAFVSTGSIDDLGLELIESEAVMFFRPVGQMVAVGEDLKGEEAGPGEIRLPEELGEPVVALLDGLPIANHPVLVDRLDLDDPDDFAGDENYEARRRIHGTSMASLIVQGDLADQPAPLSRYLYVRPILRPLRSQDGAEGMPEDRLTVDLIHRAVRRIFEGEAGEVPRAPQVRVINLSIGDLDRQFLRFMSPLARLLDWLSVEYDVLFVVSAGNNLRPIELMGSREELAQAPEKLVEETVLALFGDMGHRRILSPAETVNGLTVGAFHQERKEIVDRGDSPPVLDPVGPIDLFHRPFPSPVSSFGGGYMRSVKPDMLFYGGKQQYHLYQTDPLVVRPRVSARAPFGQKVAAPRQTTGGNGYDHTCGTSNAAALISRQAAIYHDQLQEILGEQAHLPQEGYRDLEAPLLKAMLVHGCSWGEFGPRVGGILKQSGRSRQEPKVMSGRWMGYGLPDVDRLLECTAQRVTLLGYGRLLAEQTEIFRLPLPGQLEFSQEMRHLAITLAWLSPVAASTRDYRVAALSFDVSVNKKLVPNRGGANHYAVRRGTVQHEVFTGKQSAQFEGGGEIEIRVNCRESAGKIRRRVAYGLAVSLWVGEGVNIPVYDEVRIGLALATGVVP